MSNHADYQILTYDLKDGEIIWCKNDLFSHTSSCVRVDSFLPLSQENKLALKMVYPEISINHLEAALLSWEALDLTGNTDEYFSYYTPYGDTWV